MALWLTQLASSSAWPSVEERTRMGAARSASPSFFQRSLKGRTVEPRTAVGPSNQARNCPPVPAVTLTAPGSERVAPVRGR